jgi:hypothetical protein
MKVKLTDHILTTDDEPAMEGDKPITVRTALIRAALSEVHGDGTPVKGSEKLDRYDLYRKIKLSESGDLSDSEIKVLRELVLMFPPLLAGQLTDHLLGVVK